ncbi:MAG: phosphodiester glycosidase family protein [Oscillospiraceae bacterium]
MKKIPVRATAWALALLLAAGPAASASQALGTEIHRGKIHLAEGVDYTRQYLWSATYSDLRTERYFEYSPNELVQPAVAYGDTVLAKNTLSTLAQGLENEGKRVLGGINGDYFVLATGAPLGLVITDGVLRSSSSYIYALGFDADGNAFIGKPDLSITATFGGATYAVSGGLNKVRTDNSYVLYTHDFAATTNHTKPGIDVILIPSTDHLDETVQVDLDVEDTPVQEQPGGEELDPFTGSADLDAEDVTQGGGTPEKIKDTLVYTDEPIIGGHISCTVAQVLQSTGSIEIPEGCLVLSISSDSNEWLVGQLSALQAGDTVEIDITSPDERWETAVTAIGGLYKMVTNGAVESDLETTQAPRTAVGIRADGSTVFYTVDGRQSGYSVGASMQQVAERLVELGCVEAMCLDGGGSTTLGASLPGEDSFAVLNSPSDGSQRAVTNALFLVADQTDPGRAEALALSPSDAILLSGAQLELSAAGVDNLGQTVTRYDADEVDFSLPRQAGTITDGVLTAGTQAGTYTLEAEAGRLTGSALITVVPTPDQITVRNEATGAALSALHLEPGETIDLTASAVYRNLSLVCQDACFTWSVSEGLGTIDQSGKLTTGETSGSGSVTVTAGGKTVAIPLTVSGQIRTVETFEGDFLNLSGSLTARIEPERRSVYVRYGSQSARITYDMGADEFAAFGIPLDFQDGSQYLTLWVYGDGSGNTLSASVRLTDGSSREQALTVLDFKGWQQIVAPLPDDADQILTLKITPTGTTRQGTIWLDHVTSSNQADPDLTCPAVTVELSGNTLRATVQDNMDNAFTQAQISVTYDGWALSFTLEGLTLTAALPAQDGLAHRVTVTATDASGNIGRASADIAASGERTEPFADMTGHWAKNYVNYLYDQGISNGLIVDGKTCFNPDKDITRGEFALMCARWLRLDLSAYSNVELPFADTADIPSWCLDGVKAMYALGIMQGSAEGSGVYAFAQRSISRSEAMTMLGRIQQKGYAAAELTFADAADIPAWAADYLATMVAQGVVNGYEDNTVAPNSSIKRCEMAKILYAMR